MTRSAWAGVLFDLDGTLADTVPLILDAFHHTMRAHGVTDDDGEPYDDRAWLRHVGRPLKD